jgi:hypothetical protein
MKQPLENRLLSKFTVGDGCWEWLRCKSPSGHGMIEDCGTTVQAHRAVYEMLTGPIPQGHHMHHACENPGCVRPSHLVPVLPREHVLNLTPGTFSYINKRVTVCPHGHPYDEANTIIGKDGHRGCRVCQREIKRIRYANPAIREKELERKRQASKDPTVRVHRAERDHAKYNDPTYRERKAEYDHAKYNDPAFRERKAAYDRLRRMKAHDIRVEEANNG